MIDLSGVLIPSTTPFAEDGEVALQALRDNVEKWMEAGIHGILTAGSTGESVFLDESERVALVEVARVAMPDDRILLAGTGAESTRQTIRLTKAAAEAGADAALVQPPAYYKGGMKPEALRTHYHAVADASPIPVLVYQVPLRLSTVELPTELVAELSAHENIVGIKDSRGDMEILGNLVETSQSDFQVLVGTGAFLYGALERGGVGGIMAVAAMAPDVSLEVFQAFKDGRRDEAAQLQARIAPAHNEIVGGTGIAGVKYGLDTMGYHGGEPRPPLRSLGSEGKERVEGALRGAGLLDTPPAQL